MNVYIIKMGIKKAVSKSLKSAQKMVGGFVGVALVALIISVALSPIFKKKEQKEGFFDCGAGFCEIPPP